MDKITCCVLELPLITEKWQKDELNKKMECARRIYNTMLADKLKDYNRLVHSDEWEGICRVIKEELSLSNPEKVRSVHKSKRLKEAYAEKAKMLKQYGFSDFDFRSDAIQYSKYYQKHITAVMAARGIGMPMWAAFEKLFFGNGEKVSFKKAGEILSLVSDNKSGVMLKEDGGVYYVRLSNKVARARTVSVKLKGPHTEYDRQMISRKIKCVRVIKKVEKGKDRFYCQLTVEGKPYCKKSPEGVPMHPAGSGMVGISIWRNRVSVCSADGKAIERSLLPEGWGEYLEKREELSRLLEHLRRVNNPDNYEEDGQIKRGYMKDGKRTKLCWNYSGHYMEVKRSLQELYRLWSVKKKIHQNRLIYEILAMGDEFRFADMSFVNLKPPYDEEELLSVNEYSKKKQRRKSIQDSAPSAFMDRLDKRLSQYGLEPVMRIKVPERLYWYHHDKGVSEESLFQTEYIRVDGRTVSQGLYRAFLICFYDIKTETYRQDEAACRWGNVCFTEE